MKWSHSTLICLSLVYVVCQDLKKVQTGLRCCTSVLCDHLHVMCIDPSNQIGAKEHHMGIEVVWSLLLLGMGLKKVQKQG